MSVLKTAAKISKKTHLRAKNPEKNSTLRHFVEKFSLHLAILGHHFAHTLHAGTQLVVHTVLFCYLNSSFQMLLKLLALVSVSWPLIVSSS